MTQPEWNLCAYQSCYANYFAGRLPIAVWPKRLHPETQGPFRIWSLYVEWRNGSRGNANTRRFCADHHKQLVELYGREALMDRLEQERTEVWLVKTGSRM